MSSDPTDSKSGEGTNPNDQPKVILSDQWDTMPEKLEPLVGDSGFVVSASAIFGNGKVLVEFTENKTGRSGGERHWIPRECLSEHTEGTER